MKYRVMIWIKGQRSIMQSVLCETTETKIQISDLWSFRKEESTLPIQVSDNKLEIIPVNRIEKIRIKYYEDEVQT